MAKRTPVLKFLQELEKEELIAEIEKLCTRFEVVKKYFEIELSGDAGRYVAAAKKEMGKQFYFSNGNPRGNPKASRLNGILKEFEKVSIYKSDVIALLLHRLELTRRYAMDTGGISEALHASTMLAIGRIIKLVAEEDLSEEYTPRIEALAGYFRNY